MPYLVSSSEDRDPYCAEGHKYFTDAIARTGQDPTAYTTTRASDPRFLMFSGPQGSWIGSITGVYRQILGIPDPNRQLRGIRCTSD